MSTDGLGTPPAKPLTALPPIEKLQPTLRLDPGTGEPSRAWVVRLVFWLLLLAALAEAGTLGLTWWRAIHMDTFPTSARLLFWTHPNPGSVPSILLAVATMVIGVVPVAAPWWRAIWPGWDGRPPVGGQSARWY